MPNGTLRDHLSGKWEMTCLNIPSFLFFRMTITDFHIKD
jgi:hypothetical protein